MMMGGCGIRSYLCTPSSSHISPSINKMFPILETRILQAFLLFDFGVLMLLIYRVAKGYSNLQFIIKFLF